MPLITLDNLGASGIINPEDHSEHLLAPEQLSGGQNVRFESRAVIKFVGHSAIYDPPSVAPIWLLPTFKDGSAYLIYNSTTKSYVTDGSTHKEITQVAGNYTGSENPGWNGGILHGVPIHNNSVENPQYWDRDFATPGKWVDLTDWPPASLTTLTAKVVRPVGNFLVAFDVTENGTRYEDVLRWSHPAPPGSVPSSWNETDDTKDTGRVAVGESSGPIIDCAALRGAHFLYKESEAHAMEFIGGRNIFSFKRRFATLGVMGRRCAVPFERGRKHLVLTSDADLVMHDGVSADSIVEDKWRKWLDANISGDYYERCFLIPHLRNKEIWCCIPTEDNTYCNLALVWRLKDNTFGLRELPNISHAVWTPTATSVDDAWDSDEDTWDSDDGVWDSRSFSARNTRMLFAGTADTKLYREGDTERFNGTNMTAYAERLGLGIVGRDRQGQWKVDFQRKKMVNSIWPKMEATGPVNIYLITQDIKDGPATYHGPYVFDPNTDKKVDVYKSGRILGWKVESTSNISWKLWGMDWDLKLLGQYT